jgi:hypothetical protein
LMMIAAGGVDMTVGADTQRINHNSMIAEALFGEPQRRNGRGLHKRRPQPGWRYT